ncbi:MAG: hypothetical protein V6Z81_03280 [Parvularculales bacterium]
METQRTSRPKHVGALVGRVLNRQDDYLKGIRPSDDLVEFYPSTEQRRAAALKDQERNREIQKMAREQSMFAVIASTETLLYGRMAFTTVHREDGKTSSRVAPLREISVTTELPRLMVVEPARFQQMISSFRVEKRVPQ